MKENTFWKILSIILTLFIAVVSYAYITDKTWTRDDIVEAKSIAQFASDGMKTNTESINMILLQGEQTNSFLNYIAQTLDENGIKGSIQRPTYKKIISTK